jgi:hypothetical protein
MELRKYPLVLALILSMLVACSKRQSDTATSQDPEGGSSAQSAQASPGSSAPAEAPTAPAARPVAPEAAPTAPLPPPPPPEPIVIPSGTILTVRLQQALSSKTNNEGDPFSASLAQPLTVKGKTVVPAGAGLSGTVIEAHKAGRFKGGATLDMALTSMTIGEKSYRITTMTMAQTSKGKGKRTAAMTGGGAGGGALIGGLAGGGKGAAIGALVGAGAGVMGSAFTGNRDIDIPAESAASFQLTKSLKLPPPSGTAVDRASADNPTVDNSQE